MPGDNVTMEVKLIAPIAMEEVCVSLSAKAAAPLARALSPIRLSTEGELSAVPVSVWN